MQYLISFLEGIITFISPCLLPMLPIYISYFAGGAQDEKKALSGAVGFVTGFTLVFVTMGAMAGSIGGMLLKYEKIINIILGSIVIFFGLNYMGIFNVSIFTGGVKAKKTGGGFFESVLLGVVFSVGWSPCVGVFLSSALIMASRQATMIKGILMLLSFSLGLGIPFIVSAVLIDRLKGAFEIIKKNYKTVNAVSGALLVITGILMATGMMNKILAVLS